MNEGINMDLFTFVTCWKKKDLCSFERLAFVSIEEAKNKKLIDDCCELIETLTNHRICYELSLYYIFNKYKVHSSCHKDIFVYRQLDVYLSTKTMRIFINGFLYQLFGITSHCYNHCYITVIDKHKTEEHCIDILFTFKYQDREDVCVFISSYFPLPVIREIVYDSVNWD